MCWASTSSPPGRGGSPSSEPRLDGIERRAALQHLEAVGRHQQRPARRSRRWLARPMRCSRRDEPLGAPICTTRSTAPQSMPRSSEEVATTARSRPRPSRPPPCGAARRRGCRGAARWQAVVVQVPELLEHELRLGAGVDEDQRRAGAADALVDLGQRVHRHVAGPRQVLARGEDLDLRLGAVAPDNAANAGRLGGRRQPGGQPVRVVHRRREADPAQAGGQALQAGQPSASRSPRLVPAKACNSSITTHFRFPNTCGAS
jgi:hypothetical protein